MNCCMIDAAVASGDGDEPESSANSQYFNRSALNLHRCDDEIGARRIDLAFCNIVPCFRSRAYSTSKLPAASNLFWQRLVNGPLKCNCIV